jgi:uncharacterized repeat protein (TIGR03803 family)
MLIVFCLAEQTAFSQTTAFNYQGKPKENNNPAISNYEKRFKLFDTLPALPAIPALIDPPFVEKGLPGSAFAGVVSAPDGRLYGLTYSGGTSDKGTLYSVDTTLTAVVLHVNFNGGNGAVPYDELTYDAASGKFYGTTS